MLEIKAGHTIQRPRWPEPVEVNLVEELGDYTHLVGVTAASRGHVDQLIPRQELAELHIARVAADFGAPSRHVFLGLETRRYRFASLYDPLLAMNTSKVDPLPHQIEEVYQKLRLDGEILERIVPLVIKERYLRGQEYVLTEQLAQAGLRTPGETRVVSREAWEEGIAEGVQHGLFGLGGLEDGQPMCRYFKERPLVGLSGSEIILQADICQTQREEDKRPTVYHPTSDAGGLPVKDAGDQGAGGTPGVTGGEVKEAKKTRQRMRLRFTVPKGKVSGLMGVMNLLQHKFNHLEVVLATDDGEISDQEYEDKIHEAFRQLGIDVIEE